MDRPAEGRCGTRAAAALLLAVLMVMASAAVAFADMGPKASVSVSVEDLPEGVWYATLLGSTEGYGPYNVAERLDTGNTEGDAPAEIVLSDEDQAFNAFCDWEDPDGYYFWGQVFNLSSGGFSWGYYPPDPFKILIFDVSSYRMYSSEVTSRYAFDSIYSVVLNEDGTMTVTEATNMARSTNWLGFAARVAATIIIELLVAMLFGYRTKKEIRLIVITNIVTQALLNLILAWQDYTSGAMTWVVFFPVLEIVILIIEAIVYAIGLRSHKRGRAVLYALAANLLTAFVGIYLAAFTI